MAGCVIMSTLIELASMRHLSTVVIDLCNALSPEMDPVSISSYNYFKVRTSFPIFASQFGSKIMLTF